MSFKYLITFRTKRTLSHFKTDCRCIVWSLQHRLKPCANTVHHSKYGVLSEVGTDRTINSVYNYFSFIPPRSL